MTVLLYGIPNCTTVKKARAWLDGHACAVPRLPKQRRRHDNGSAHGSIARGLSARQPATAMGCAKTKKPRNFRSGAPADSDFVSFRFGVDQNL